MAQASDIPSQMRGLVCSGYGNPPETISVKDDLAVPQPGENEILVRVQAASLNPLDYKLSCGYLQSIPQMALTFPKIPGYDVAGTVVQLGANVSTYAIGDEVMGQVSPMGVNGSFAEYTVMNIVCCAPKPPNMSFIEAAGAPCVTNTSYQALTMYSEIVPGETNVMVLGGSSATGIMAIQIAKVLGAKFVATTSTQADLCSGLGADVVVNYREADWTQVLAETKFDIIYDCAGSSEDYTKSPAVCKPESVFVSIAQQPPAEPLEFPQFKFIMQNPTKSAADWAVYFADERLKVVVDERSPYTLETSQNMYQDLMSRSAHGKLVLTL